MKTDQTLHGYSDGHRELAASVTLDAVDARLMLALSDTSGSGGNVLSTGYLTGYPLPTGRAYALARTWPADEMPRPGCVWTHTLLIDFADLATLTSFGELLAFFRSPHMQDYGSYREAIAVDLRREPIALTVTEATWARHVVAALYEQPDERIVAARPASIDVERVVLALWGQQWPRLRRSFRFCTFATADRSDGDCSFDLQLLPAADFNARRRFPATVAAPDLGETDGAWLGEATRDLAHPDHNGLRSFLRRVGGDRSMGRRTFRSLCELHSCVTSFSTAEHAIPRAISLLEDELGTGTAHSARKAVAEEIVEHARNLDRSALEFLMQHLESIDVGRLQANAVRIGEALWSLEPSILGSFLEKPAPYRLVLERTVETLALSRLVTGLSRAQALAHLAVQLRPEVLTQSYFWSEAYDVDGYALSVMAGSDRVRDLALAALVGSGREDLATRVVHEFGLPSVLGTISGLLAGREHLPLDRWLTLAGGDLEGVAEYLSAVSNTRKELLVALARRVPPDAVPNEIGTDPWLHAYQHAAGSISEDSSAYLQAYLLARALGRRSRSAADLARVSFDTVYRLMAGNRLPYEAWRLVEPRLPRAKLLFEWDQCERLRRAIVRLFVKRRLDSFSFLQLTEDDKVFMDDGVDASSQRHRNVPRWSCCDAPPGRGGILWSTLPSSASIWRSGVFSCTALVRTGRLRSGRS